MISLEMIGYGILIFRIQFFFFTHYKIICYGIHIFRISDFPFEWELALRPLEDTWMWAGLDVNCRMQRALLQWFGTCCSQGPVEVCLSLVPLMRMYFDSFGFQLVCWWSLLSLPAPRTRRLDLSCKCKMSVFSLAIKMQLLFLRDIHSEMKRSWTEPYSSLSMFKLCECLEVAWLWICIDASNGRCARKLSGRDIDIEDSSPDNKAKMSYIWVKWQGVRGCRLGRYGFAHYGCIARPVERPGWRPGPSPLSGRWAAPYHKPCSPDHQTVSCRYRVLDGGHLETSEG